MKTKDRILETSLKLFNEHGINAITTNHIADAMGISPGSLYYHFKNKEEIVRALFTRMIDSVDSNFQFDRTQPVDMNMVVGLFQKNFSLILKYPLFAREFIPLTYKDPELISLIDRMKRRRFEEIEHILLGLIEAGIMRRPDRGVTLQSLIEMIWLIAFFWVPYVALNDQPLNELAMEKGMEMVLNLIRPYLKEMD